MNYILAFILALTLSGCDKTGSIAGALNRALAETTAPADPVELTLIASDGLSLTATLYPGAGPAPRPGLLLLHMLGSDRSAWAPTAERLAAAGYSALALDLRGHGASEGPVDWNKARQDILDAWQYLIDQPGVDGQKTALIGGSIGANLALAGAAVENRINTVVLLSPGLNYAGLTTDDAVDRYGKRPALLVASDEDTYAADSSRQLAQLALGDARLEQLQGAGHGTQMLGRHPALVDTILAWLAANLQGVPLQTADVLAVQASPQGNTYNLSVEIASPDLGCEQYADWWEVLSDDGELLYRRVLLHSHVNEQPFVRSGGPLRVEPGQTLWVRAHMFPQGYGGTAFVGSVRDGFRPAGLFPGFAHQVALQEPLPQGCGF